MSKWVHPDGYRAEVEPAEGALIIKVARLSWPADRVVKFPVATPDEVLPWLVDSFGDGWKLSKS